MDLNPSPLNLYLRMVSSPAFNAHNKLCMRVLVRVLVYSCGYSPKLGLDTRLYADFFGIGVPGLPGKTLMLHMGSRMHFFNLARRMLRQTWIYLLALTGNLSLTIYPASRGFL